MGIHRNPFWLVFLGLILSCALFFTGLAGYRLWEYLRLDKQISVQTIKWSVFSLNEDRFVPVAEYTFTLDGKQHQGRTLLQEGFLNKWTALEAIERLVKSPPPVWYVGSNPAISSLEKLFPFKQVFYSFLLWILEIYLIGLGTYVNKRHPF